MDFIKGINFAPFAPRGVLSSPAALESLDCLLREMRPNTVILTPAGVQKNAQSETIDFTSESTMADEELLALIRRIHARNVRVILKPTVNCLDGTWRAHIHFFDNDVPGEPQWGNWFSSYMAFQAHYARIAEREGCEMFIPGCEMVMSERREKEWRMLIAGLRTVYSGPIAYNCDKYQEDQVRWWDCVDVIASSGYYPLDSWETQLDRIERVVRRYDKPFFFAELGCMATQGSSLRPNDWTLAGGHAPQEQAAWYRAMFSSALKRDWVRGFAFWDWSAAAFTKPDRGYNLRGTPALSLIRQAYHSLSDEEGGSPCRSSMTSSAAAFI